MRIIAGEARGRRLKSIRGTTTRPTLDRVKESIFNMLGPSLYSISVLDLFAGFGGLGLEALSRGAESVIFVEKEYRNVKIIKENIKICGFVDRAQVERKDVFAFLSGAGGSYDLILMDPPYGGGLALRAVKQINKEGIIAQQGLIVVEHGLNDKMEELPDLDIIKEKTYGDTCITIYQAGGRDD